LPAAWRSRLVAGEAFVQGVVLYLGRATVPFGPQFTAVPLDALW